MGLGKILDISKNSLAVYRKALDVTSNNIANASNADYSRQTVQFASESSDGISGTGVKILDITRVRNELVDRQIRGYSSKYSEADTRSSILGQVESLVQEPSDSSLNAFLTNFYNSWSELSVNPSSTALRLNVVQSASNLSSKFQGIYQGINQIKDDMVKDLQGKVDTLNYNLGQIQSLNQKIFEAQTSGQDTGALKDQRDKLIDDISGLANVNVTTNTSGDASITVGGIYAADRFVHTEFAVNTKNGELSITPKNSDVQAQLNGGEIYAMTDMYTNTLNQYTDTLDTIANSIMENVNNVHSQGTNLKGETGISFFSDYSDGVLKINDKISKDVNNIAVSADGTTGNGDIATKLASLKDQKLLNGKTIMDNYTNFISGIGSDKALADQNAEANQLVLTQLQNQRSATSGVSLDEEMTNVIRFQRSYDASAKLIKVADELLQSLLDMV
jgi:flagellar hook-associated protein 1 FlgK